MEDKKTMDEEVLDKSSKKDLKSSKETADSKEKGKTAPFKKSGKKKILSK